VFCVPYQVSYVQILPYLIKIENDYLEKYRQYNSKGNKEIKAWGR
jgi:hypothetical protein